jgi:type 1 glutamine amidotransferase
MFDIERNKHSAGRVNNIMFGVCQLGDGLVRVVSLGFLHTRWTVNHARNSARRAIEMAAKRARENRPTIHRGGGA